MLKLKNVTKGAKETIGTIRLKKDFGRNKLLNLKVAIIGAGISGLSAALLLKKLKCDVTVFEKNKYLRNEGAGIQITSNGSFVLKKLGLDKRVIRAGIKPNKLCLFDEDDFKCIGSLEILERLKGRYGRPFITLNRSLLVKILFEKVKQEKIQVKFGSGALPLVGEDGDNISISYNGKKINKDLIVVADGVGSSWKKTIFREIKNRSISQCAYRFVLNNTKLPAIFSDNNINLFFGKGRHFVTYPTGNNGMINFVFCKRESGKMINDWKEKVSKQQFLNDFEIDESLQICLPGIKNIYRWPVIESEIPITLQKKNVVKTIFREIKNRSISQCAYRFVLNNTKLPAIFSDNNINLFFGKGRHFVTYPTGNNGMINFVFCKRESGKMINDWKEKVSKQQFLNDFEIDESLQICLPGIKNIYRWPVIESEIPITLQKKNVVMVGDAAHGMLPYMAQGANKALEDSWELSKCIKEFPLDLSKGLSRYSKKRIRRIRQLDKISNFNEKAYHLEQKILRRTFFVFLRLITVFSPNFFFKRLDWIYKHEG